MWGVPACPPHPVPPGLGDRERCGISVSFVLGTMRLPERAPRARSCRRNPTHAGLGEGEPLRELQGRQAGETHPQCPQSPRGTVGPQALC